MKTQTAVVKAQPSTRENLKLAGIFLFLIIAATMMSTLSGFNGVEWVRWFMGGFMIIFGGLKLVGIEVFLKVFPLYDLIAKKFPPYKYIYSMLQVFLGMLYILGIFSVFRNLLTIACGLSGLIGMVQIVSDRGAIKLSYLGTIIKLRYSTVTLIENSIMVILGFTMLVAEIAFM